MLLCIMFVLQFKFATPSDYAFLLTGLVLAFIHGLTISGMWIIFSNALENFANYHISCNYFHCINQDTINCSSNVLYCSNVTNQTGCCFDDSSYQCVDEDQFLYNMGYWTISIIISGVYVFFGGWTHTAIFRYTGDRQMLEIRKSLLSSIIHQDIKWFDTVSSEEITSRMIE